MYVGPVCWEWRSGHFIGPAVMRVQCLNSEENRTGSEHAGNIAFIFAFRRRTLVATVLRN
jgi:hypothetical protein